MFYSSAKEFDCNSRWWRMTEHLVSAYKIIVFSFYNKDVLHLISSFLFFLSVNLALKCFPQPKCSSKLDRYTITCETKLTTKMGCLVFTLPDPPQPAGQLPVCSSVQGAIDFLTDFLPLLSFIIWRLSSFSEISAISQMVSRALFKMTIENLSRPFVLISLIIFSVDFSSSLWRIRNKVSWLLHNYRY